MSKFSDYHRYYRETLPSKDDVVIGQFISRNDFGYNVRLLEYDGLVGFMVLVEVSRRTRHRKKNIVRIGEICPMVVKSVNEEKKQVNLSKRYVQEDEIGTHMQEMFAKSCMNKIGYEIYAFHKQCYPEPDESLTTDQVYEKTIWPLMESGKKIEFSKKPFNEMYTNLKNDIATAFNLTNNDGTFEPEFKDAIVNNFNSRIKESNVILGLDVMVLILNERGVESLKEILDLDEFANDFKMKINISRMPVYSITFEGNSEEQIRNILNNLKIVIQQRTTERKGVFNVSQDVHVIKASDKSMTFIGYKNFEKINKLEDISNMSLQNISL